ncbi:hypothetical protein E2320_008555 [Naja naja]|nr:hypothetical protein E2320_008555 [Naja naja]
MQWLWNQDASRDLLLAVHPPNYIVLWNADTGTKLWKKSYAENILSFSFDPFDPSNLTLLTTPISSGKKVYISSPHSSPVHNKLVSATGAKKALDKVKILITNEKPSAESVTLNDCLQLSYLPSKRNYMLLLYPREILVLDLEVNQTVGVIAIERTGVPFLQVIPCCQRDGLFCLHENGCITLRVRRSTTNLSAVPNEESADPDPIQELIYDLRSQCDAIRVTKTVRPFSMNKLPDLSLDNMISALSTEDQAKSYCLQEVHLKFILTGLLSGLPLPPFAIRMGIEWTGLNGFLSFATSTPNNLGLVRNELQVVDLPTGRSIAFRGERGNDEPAIEMIKVSHLKQYLAVVFKDKPLELWDIRTCTLLREMSKNFPTITALEWSPSHNLKSLRKKQLAAREAMARQTVVSDTEQSSLESSMISLLQEAESKSELSQNISAREHFVFTDTDGQVFHLTVEGNSVKDSARIPPDGSMGSITCIAWKGDTLVLGDVDGNLNFWDLKARVQMVSSLRSGRNVSFRVLDVDWCTSDKVILASDDGCIRVLEMTMKPACFRMDEQEFNYPENANIKNMLQEQLYSLSNDVKKLLLDPEFTLLQRCLLVSRLYGDESELHFWTVAAHYLHTYSCNKSLTIKAEDVVVSQENWISPLDICYDILCENSYFQKFQLERVNIQEVKRSNYDHTRKCTDQLLLLGQTDRAVQLLLETSAENPYYYCDSLKACLVTTVTSSGPSQSTIKLVATNMIANGKLAEGVQLLCLIDKAADACRYLQTYGEWNRAAWLAKVRLNAEECADVLKRWVDHLCSPQINQKSKAILVLLSLGCFMRVAEMLHSMRHFDRAALFLEACLKYGTIEKLIHAIFADYARSLKSLGFKQAAILFATKAGVPGKNLLSELEQQKEEVKE